MDCLQPLYKLCSTKTGYRWVIEGDIKACFDRIPHDKLVAEVARRIADPHILKLIRSFLKSGIRDQGKLAPSEEGTPQGGIVQPTEKGLKRIKQKIKEMTGRKTLNDDYLHKLEAVNALVRGWASYYRAVNPYRTFDELDQYVWIRLRRWLQKKYQVSSLQVRKRYMRHRNGPEGGYAEFAAQDAEGTWVWRARATRTKLIYYRPSWKRHSHGMRNEMLIAEQQERETGGRQKKCVSLKGNDVIDLFPDKENTHSV